MRSTLWGDNMENIIIVAILGLIAAAIIFYLVRQKKKGVKCVGCPCGGKCGGSCGGSRTVK